MRQTKKSNEMNTTNTNTIAATAIDTAIIGILSTINNGSFVGVESVTTPKMRKTGNPFNGRLVQKVTNQVLQFGYSYENAVVRRSGDKEFTAEPLAWGEWLIPNKVITHKDKLYVRLYKVDNEKCVSNTMYLIDGIIATEEEEAIIKQFLIAPSDSRRQAEVGLTEHQVQPRNFAFDSIVGLSVNDTLYDIRKQREELAVVTA